MIRISESFRDDGRDDREPAFEPGRLVRHRRYGYRGVVVASDGHCRADPKWYMSNTTQPDREQPWYHVLVDGRSATTYAAESSLRVDPDPGRIGHPLVTVFFDGFDGERYIRNETPWPD